MDSQQQIDDVVNGFIADYIKNIRIQADVWWPSFSKIIKKSNQKLSHNSTIGAFMIWFIVMDWVGGKQYLKSPLPSYIWPEIAHKLGYKPEYFLRWQFAAENFYNQRHLSLNGPDLFDLFIDIYKYHDEQFVIRGEKKIVHRQTDILGDSIKASSILDHFK